MSPDCSCLSDLEAGPIIILTSWKMFIDWLLIEKPMPGLRFRKSLATDAPRLPGEQVESALYRVERDVGLA